MWPTVSTSDPAMACDCPCGKARKTTSSPARSVGHERRVDERRVRGGQRGEQLGHRGARVRVGGDLHHLDLGMAREQAQQLGARVPRSPDDCRSIRHAEYYTDDCIRWRARFTARAGGERLDGVDRQRGIGSRRVAPEPAGADHEQHDPADEELHRDDPECDVARGVRRVGRDAGRVVPVVVDRDARRRPGVPLSRS